MGEEGKKISFGFAKSIKKPLIKNTTTPKDEKVHFIECLTENSIKIIGGEEKTKEPLVIPLLSSKSGGNTWHDRIVNKTNADIFDPTRNSEKDALEAKHKNTNSSSSALKIKEEKKDEENSEQNGTKSLEEQAAMEILQNIKTEGDETKEINSLSLSLTDEHSLRGEEEPTLDDYEQIPIEAFGEAMLRGMGWKPGSGIGKNEKIIEASIPELRPRGMGLGADKLSLQKQPTNTKTEEEENLKLVKGAFVKIIVGKKVNYYGEIEGLDDDTGRIIIKLALGGDVITVNEYMVRPVTKVEYLKNAKVLNADKYERYKNEKSERSREDEDDEQDKHSRLNVKTVDSREDSDGERKSKKRKEGSDDSDYKSKKSKKYKKHKRRESSCERSSRKSRKKEKERDRTRDRRYSSSPERRKHKSSKSQSSKRR